MLIHKGTQTLHTERLTLRPFTPDDAPDMFRNYARDARVTRFLSWTPYESIDGVRAFLAAIEASYARKNVYHWAIVFDGEVIGSISTIAIDEKNLSCEIGYAIGYDFWNRGFTTEAMRAVIAFLFTQAGMERIVAKHDVENPASGRVMLKCGMTNEGRWRKHYRRHDGTRSDALYYALLKEDFFQQTITN